MTGTKRLTLADVRRVAKKYGAEVDERHSGPSGRYFNVMVDLPKGRTWGATNGHCLSCTTGPNPDAAERSECCRDVIESAEEYGVNEPEEDGTCGDPDCDFCHPEEDE